MGAMASKATMRSHPDRLLPVDPTTRAVARRLYEAVRAYPIISPHGHVDARVLAEDAPFGDPTALLITPDHYVTRLLHASGVPLASLGVGRPYLTPEESREAWRLMCAHWHVYRGTPVRYWLEGELSEIFGVSVRPSASTGDEIYDTVAERLADPRFRPRALFERFGIDLLATTDDPADDLAHHRALAADEGFHGRVVPTFRPDRYLEVGRGTWPRDVARLGEAAGVDPGTYRGWVAAMERRREYFIEHGARASDHSHEDAGTAPLSDADRDRTYADALAGRVSPDAAAALRRHMLLEMARMAADDGLTMMLHPGVRRGHHGPTAERFGPDTGHDIPLSGEFTDSLRPLLERFGNHPGLRLVLFTLDETTFSRELAPLAGFYSSVYVGAPWWFLDAPEAIQRWRSAVTETVGFSRTSGFIDDTRAFCSIPVRHDMSRRLDAGYLARLVTEHRLDEDEALETVVDLVAGRPRETFGL